MSALDDAYRAADLALDDVTAGPRTPLAHRHVINAFFAHLADNPPENAYLEALNAVLESDNEALPLATGQHLQVAIPAFLRSITEVKAS